VTTLELVTYAKDGGILFALLYAMFLGSKMFRSGIQALNRNTIVLSRIEGHLGMKHESSDTLKFRKDDP
jgi:hypothetical protein